MAESLTSSELLQAMRSLPAESAERAAMFAAWLAASQQEREDFLEWLTADGEQAAAMGWSRPDSTREITDTTGNRHLHRMAIDAWMRGYNRAAFAMKRLQESDPK